MSVAPVQIAVNAKPAATRLLNLLAGWAAFVSADEESGVTDAALTAEEIGALYQAAGEESEKWTGLSPDEADERLRAFVEQRIVPALLHRPGPFDEFVSPPANR